MSSSVVAKKTKLQLPIPSIRIIPYNEFCVVRQGIEISEKKNVTHIN